MDLVESHYRQYKLSMLENPMQIPPTKYYWHEGVKLTLPQLIELGIDVDVDDQPTLKSRPFSPQLLKLRDVMHEQFQDRWVDHLEFRNILTQIELPCKQKTKELRPYGAYRYWGRCVFNSVMNELAMWKRSGVLSTRSGVWFAAKASIPDLSGDEFVVTCMTNSIVRDMQRMLKSAEVVRHPLGGDHRYATVRINSSVRMFLDEVSAHNDEALKTTVFLKKACKNFENNLDTQQMAEVLGLERPVLWPDFKLYASTGKVLHRGSDQAVEEDDE